jgi:large subunit ribosomal protein L13e
MKHNNVLPNVHLRKDWKSYTRVKFNQAKQKTKRYLLRKQGLTSKQLLRPLIICPTNKYNIKSRIGKGFSLLELKKSGITKKQALSLGISIDHRRRNLSNNQLLININRLINYKESMIINPKSNDSKVVSKIYTSPSNTLVNPTHEIVSSIDKSSFIKSDSSAFMTLRKAKSDLRYKSIREIRAKAKLEAEESKSKK